MDVDISGLHLLSFPCHCVGWPAGTIQRKKNQNSTIIDVIENAIWESLWIFQAKVNSLALVVIQPCESLN